MRPVVLVYPPACDPTAPYLSVPTLAAYLRRHDVPVVPVDANVEAFDWLLTPARMRACADRLEERLAALERKPRLRHAEQLLLGALWSARGDAVAVPGAIAAAVAVLRDPARFYDVEAYGGAVATVEAAVRLASAACAPLQMTFTAYRTPFSLLNAEEIARDAAPERNPFHGYFAGPLVEKIRAADPVLVGISIAFPGQVQPAYALAHVLRQALPGVRLVAGGPALTQLFQGLPAGNAQAAAALFDHVVTYEGEKALLGLVHALEQGDTPPRFIPGEQVTDLGALPPPDFSGLPLEKYLAPEVVLPYDPTRGCYWGKCTFCHYGLAETGTAAYRERPVDDVVNHLEDLQRRHGTRVFYFSQDAVNPKTMLRMVQGLRARGVTLRWSTDMRPERSLTPERCRELRDGGALSMALGVESAAPRVLGLIDKGVPVETVRDAMRALSGADIGVEAMCFTDFPTENYREAMATVRFVEELAEHVALFICGEFELTKGSLVARDPARFGVAETWKVAGDELGLGLFWREQRDPKSADERARVDDALSGLSRRWRLEHYPWAGALSTAHTLLYYERFGPDCFRRFSSTGKGRVPGAQPRTFPSRYDVVGLLATAAEHEAAAWEELIQQQRAVSRAAYRTRVDGWPAAEPRPGRYRVAAGEPVREAGGRSARGRNRAGRRASHAHHAARDPVRGWS
ncbi:MAG: radical SAM protein [Deltaproteobacteria bacterium]|nr:radical SAM protein [Deltaproteobacteria bacterium]